MDDSAQSRLRRLSLTALGVAFVLLAVGLAVLQNRLRGLGFILYWLACLALVGLAIVGALLDFLMIRRQARRARRELARRTVRGLAGQIGTAPPSTGQPAQGGPANRNRKIGG